MHAVIKQEVNVIHNNHNYLMKVNIEDHTLKHIVIRLEMNVIHIDHNYLMKVNIEDHVL